MPKQTFYEGQTATNPATGEKIVYQGGKWAPVTSADPTGTDQPYAPLTPGADSRSRIVLGLGPSVQAQRNIFEAEGWKPKGTPGGRGGENPYDKHPIATLIGNLDNGKWIGEGLGISLDPIAKKMGGQEYQNYEQANKSFEAAFLPVLSGAAVTPTEAQRMIKASAPMMGDSPETLARKSLNRAMMINGAADLAGKPRPFPKVGTWDFAGNKPWVEAPLPKPAAAPAQQGQGWKVVGVR